jgi:hypothetical protein
MLDYHKKLSESVIIPYTDGRYSCVFEKCIYDNLTNSLLEVNDVGCVSIDIEGLPSTIHVSFLIAMAYKPIYLPVKYWRKIHILFKDNNSTNWHPKNLIWKFDNVLRNKYWSDYAYIPGFTRYGISSEGNIISFRTGELLSVHISSVGYPSVRIVRDDNREVIMSVHVLKVLSKSQYDNNVCSLVIDHVDGNKLNLDDENLDHVTFGENNRRAILHGLKNKKFRTVCVSYKDKDEIIEFESPAAVAKHFNVKNSSIFHHLNKASKTAFKDVAFIWYKDVGKPEFDYSSPKHLAKEVLCQKELSNGVKHVRRFKTFTSCYHEMGWTKKSLEYQLKKPNGCIDGWFVSWVV